MSKRKKTEDIELGLQKPLLDVDPVFGTTTFSEQPDVSKGAIPKRKLPPNKKIKPQQPINLEPSTSGTQHGAAQLETDASKSVQTFTNPHFEVEDLNLPLPKKPSSKFQEFLEKKNQKRAELNAHKEHILRLDQLIEDVRTKKQTVHQHIANATDAFRIFVKNKSLYNQSATIDSSYLKNAEIQPYIELDGHIELDDLRHRRGPDGKWQHTRHVDNARGYSQESWEKLPFLEGGEVHTHPKNPNPGGKKLPLTKILGLATGTVVSSGLLIAGATYGGINEMQKRKKMLTREDIDYSPSSQLKTNFHNANDYINEQIKEYDKFHAEEAELISVHKYIADKISKAEADLEFLNTQETPAKMEDYKVEREQLKKIADLYTLEMEMYSKVYQVDVAQRLNKLNEFLTEKSKEFPFLKEYIDKAPIGGSLLGQKYTGPGNSLNRGEPSSAVDEDSWIHDIQYTNSKQFQDIVKADEEYFNKMLDHLSTFSVANADKDHLIALAGAVGIGVKKTIEGQTGVLYPQLSSNHGDKSMSDTPFGKDKNGKPLNVSQWIYQLQRIARNKHFGQQQADAFFLKSHQDLIKTIGEEKYRNLFKPTEKRFHLNKPEFKNYWLKGDVDLVALHQDLVDDPQEPGPSNEPTAKKPRTEENNTPAPTTTEPTTTSTTTTSSLENSFDKSILESDQSSITMDDPMDVTSSTGPAEHGMSSSPAGVVPDQIFIAKGEHRGPDFYVYNNSFRMKSWGYAPHYRAGTAAGDNTWEIPGMVSTGFVDLPVNDLCFYLPENRFDMLKREVNGYWKAKTVTIKVTPICETDSFGTNTALSGSAATSHPIYGVAAIGLNKKLRTTPITIEVKDMKISNGKESTDNSEWANRVWGTRRTNENTSPLGWGTWNSIIDPVTFMGILQPSLYGANPSTTSNNYTKTYITGNNRAGFETINNVIPVISLIPRKGKPIINYSQDLNNGIQLGAVINRGNIYWDKHTRQFQITKRPDYHFQIMRNDQPDLIFPDRDTETTANDITRIRDKLNFRLQHAMEDYGKCKVNGEFKDLPLIESANQNFIEYSDLLESVTFGVEPIKANTPFAVDDFVNVGFDFYIETSIVFDYIAYPFSNHTRGVPSLDVLKCGSISTVAREPEFVVANHKTDGADINQYLVAGLVRNSTKRCLSVNTIPNHMKVTRSMTRKIQKKKSIVSEIEKK